MHIRSWSDLDNAGPVSSIVCLLIWSPQLYPDYCHVLSFMRSTFEYHICYCFEL